MYTGIIYKYTSPSGKIYIGQTTREKARRREFLDINRLYAGKAINNARLKYGTKAFTYEVLLTLRASSKEELSKLLNYNEKYFINLFHSNINKYNITFFIKYCHKGIVMFSIIIRNRIPNHY